MIPLPVLEDITDRSGIAPRTEVLLPAGMRPRQLAVRTLLLGMLIVLADHRPAHLTRVHHALTTLPEDDQRRLGVIADWKHGPHQLTYRQTERTFGLVTGALAKDTPDGLPSTRLQRLCDDLLQASIPDEFTGASTSLAVDWTDTETFSRPPSRGTRDCADPEASWGHRSGGGPGQDSELFFGYYASAATMMREEHGPAVPELARRMTVCSCRHDPARALVPVLTAMPADGIALGDILADSGYAHRDATAWAIPVRAAGGQLIQDLHPNDRGPRGTHHGAIIANGNLYCPATPTTLLELGPLARDATPEQAAAHDQQTAETAPWRTANSARSPATTPTATTASPAPRPRARSAARSARLPDPGPRPARDPHPAPAPARLLHPADHHRAAGRRRQNPAETRLPLGGAPQVLRPPHRRRTDLLHHQGPRQQQHRPRLDPAHGPDPDHPLAHLPARRPQPAHPDRLGHPPSRQRPPRRSRPAPQNPPPPPQDPHQPRRHHSAAITRPRPSAAGTGTSQITQTTARRTQPAAHNSHGSQEPSPEPGSSREHANTPGAHENVRPKREDKRRSNVKAFWWSGTGSNCQPSAFQVNRAKRCANLRKRTSLTSETALGGRCAFTLAGPVHPVHRARDAPLGTAAAAFGAIMAAT
jgi:hypothetical protein